MSGSDKLRQHGVVAPRTFGSLRKTSLGLGAPAVLVQEPAAPLTSAPSPSAEAAAIAPPSSWRPRLARSAKAPLPRVNAGLSTTAIAVLAVATLVGLVAASLYIGHEQSGGGDTSVPVRSSHADLLQEQQEELPLHPPGRLPAPTGSEANVAVTAPLSTGSALSEPLRQSTSRGLDRAGLDQRLVASALGAQRASVKACLPEATAPVRVRVTFAPDGHVMGAKSLSEPFANTQAGTCLEASLRQVSIPAFQGAPLAVETLLEP